MRAKIAATDYYISPLAMGRRANVPAAISLINALNELVDKRKEKTISSDFPRVKYESFLPAQGVKAVAFDKGMANEFDGYFRTALDSGKDPKQILTDLSSVVKCQRRHLVEGSNFEEACPSF